ncbi:MAG: hypothetical protein ABEL76_10095 [Bradymonadaceae bacterium]
MPSLLDEELRRRWGAFGEVSGDRLLAVCSRDFADRPEQRRKLIALWLARRLDYSASLRTRRALTTDPLWSLLNSGQFGRLDEGERWVLAILAETTGGACAGQLPPRSATAAVALWYHAEQPKLRERAAAALERSPLPHDRAWLDRLVGRSIAGGRFRADLDRGLYRLACRQLGSAFWEVPTLIGALMLGHRFGRWPGGTDDEDLLYATDRAVDRGGKTCLPWFELMAEAAAGGRLRHAWLERPVRAVLRRRAAAGESVRRLRAYHDERRYEADVDRIEQLYELHLERFDRSTEDGRWARRRLLDEVRRAASANPRRAVRLLESMAVRRSPLRIGPRRVRLRRALRQAEDAASPGPVIDWLTGLYVHTFDIEPHARRLVQHRHEQLDWSTNPFADRETVAQYLAVSDYQRGFHGLTYSVAGVELDIADKDAAAAVRYYVEGRAANTTRWMRGLLRRISSQRVRWGLDESRIETAAELMRRLVRRIASVDRRGDVVDLFDRAGSSVVDFEDVVDIGADTVVDVARPDHGVRTALAGLVGAGASLAEFAGIPAASLAGTPLCLGIALDLASRFPWYWGFDPRTSPELIDDVLRVALFGPAPDAELDPYPELARYVARASLVGEALSGARADRLAERVAAEVAHQLVRGDGRTAAKLFAAQTTGRVAEQVTRSRPSLHRRLVIRFGGLMWGTVAGLALVHDTGEAARAVLTDRFLARKYPDWERTVAVPRRAEGASP